MADNKFLNIIVKDKQSPRPQWMKHIMSVESEFSDFIVLTVSIVLTDNFNMLGLVLLI